jgi:O-antigen/teichoic acid export membrane protein
VSAVYPARRLAGEQDGSEVALTDTLRRDSGSMALATLVVGGLNFGFTLVLTWMLPVHQYSVFAAAQTLLLAAVNISSASLPWVVAHAVASPRRDDRGRRDAISFVTTTCLLEGAVLAAIVLLVAERFSSRLVLGVLLVDVFVIFSTAPAVGYLQGSAAFGRLATLRVANVVAKLLCGLGLVAIGTGAAGALVSYTAGDLPLLVVGSAAVLPELRPRLAALRRRPLWRQTLGLAAVQGGVAGLAAVDLVLATLLWRGATAELVGYQVAILLSRVPFFLSSSLAQTAFQKQAASRQQAPAVIKVTTRLVVLVFVPTAVLVATVPGYFLHHFFPAAYGGVGRLLPYTATSGLLVAAINVFTTFFQAEQRYRRCLVGLASSVLDVIALLVGFHLAGIPGMAAGSVVGLGLVLLALIATAARTWPLRGLVRARDLAAPAAALPAIALHDLPAPWLVYGVLLFGGCSYTAFWRRRSGGG